MRVADMWQRVQELFKPYSLEDYVRDYDPQTPHELEQIERNWQRIMTGAWFNRSQ